MGPHPRWPHGFGDPVRCQGHQPGLEGVDLRLPQEVHDQGRGGADPEVALRGGCHGQLHRVCPFFFHASPLEIADGTDREWWTTDPFKALQCDSSKRAYRQCGTDLITFIVGGRKRLLGKVHVELTRDQKALAEVFVEAAKRRDGSDMGPLQDLFYSLFTQQLGNQTCYAFPVYRFLVLYSFRRDGTVRPCNEITQIISKLVFWARGCILKRIRSIMDHEQCGFFS
jgi:hypothetical protein